MWTNIAKTRLNVPVTIQAQGVKQTDLLILPTGTEGQLQGCELRQKGIYQGFQRRTKRLQIFFTESGDLFPRVSELGVPCIQSLVCGLCFQKRVTLLQSAIKAPPLLKKVWFHVKQRPIDKSTAHVGDTSNQFMTSWLKGQNRELLAELTKVCDVCAIDTGIPGISAVLQPGLVRALLLILPTHYDLQVIGAVFNEAFPNPTTEAAAVTQNMDGFDDAGFA
jgi:hypothetical protein